MPIMNEMLLKLYGFQYATTIDLNTGYYHIQLKRKRNLFMYDHSPVGKISLQASTNGS